MQPDLPFLLLRAYESEYGIKVRTNNTQLLRNRLYAERKKFPEFSGLSILQPPTMPDTHLWIVKKEAKNGAT